MAVLSITLALAAAAAWGPDASDPSVGASTKSTQPFPPPEARLAPGAKDAPEVMDLLRQRRDVVKTELDQARKLLGDPNFRAEAWTALAERLLVAECDAAATPAERLAAYRAFRDNLKQMEDRLKDVAPPSHGQGYFEYGQKLWIRGRRLQAEVSLLRNEAGGADSSSSGDEPAPVRQALAAWRDAVRDWARMWLDSRIVLIPAFAREIAATVLAAEVAAARDQAERIAAYRAYRDRLLAVERDVKTEVEKRRYNAFDYLRIKEMRCDADVVLGRLQAGDKSGDKNTPEVAAALDEWRQTIDFEADIIRKRHEPAKVPPEEELAVDESLLREELAAATRPDHRLAAYKKFLARLKEAESSLHARAGDRPGGKEDAARVSFSRAAAELTLLELTRAPGPDAATAAKPLLREQRDALRAELRQRLEEWTAGQGDFQLLQESAGHLLLAELATADTPAERLAAYQAHADRMRAAESSSKALLEAKKGADVWLLWTRGARLEADVWLLRAKRNLAAAATGGLKAAD
jgi:hypothetical protein